MSNGTDDYGTTKIRIPYFDPDKPSITAKAWIQFVELARKSAGTAPAQVKKGGSGPDKDELVTKTVSKWSDEVTCTNAMLMLQGAGSRWIENILETAGEEMTSWSSFKKSFKDRFVRTLTLTEKMNLRDLKMTASESCRDFYDRCTNNLNLFYDDEWETLAKNTEDKSAKPTSPWEAPGAIVTQIHIDTSQKFYQKAKNIELKLAFASGLREAIKKQVLFQDSKTVDDILLIAQRVESGLKEIKKSDIASVSVDQDDNDDCVDVGAVNFRQKKKSTTTYKTGGGIQTAFKCHYCQKPGHYKAKCMTMINDRKKGIFKSNINAPLSKAKVNSVDANDDDQDDDNDSGVNNCQVDLQKFLNFHSA